MMAGYNIWKLMNKCSMARISWFLLSAAILWFNIFMSDFYFDFYIHLYVSLTALLARQGGSKEMDEELF